MSGWGLVFGILLGAVLLLSMWRARQRKQRMGPEAVLEDLDPREREAIARELKAGRTLSAIARLQRSAPGLSPDAVKAVIGHMEREPG